MADAATVKRDYELLAGLPDTFADDRDGQVVNVVRAYAYESGRYGHQLFLLSRETHHVLNVLAEQSQAPSPTRGSVFRRAAEGDLPQWSRASRRNPRRTGLDVRYRAMSGRRGNVRRTSSRRCQ
ncbi:hypothetical protein [Streptomyces sp. WAC01280]|uniref:hypothetical protein n=1 Tax=Streptomyces sp. WAC01280 TaxID=2487424 RepID=UPI00163C8738|nr:hypothetical protein [Streptomyces sp. WAC01280]